jgi:hypothetical protein
VFALAWSILVGTVAMANQNFTYTDNEWRVFQSLLGTRQGPSGQVIPLGKAWAALIDRRLEATPDSTVILETSLTMTNLGPVFLYTHHPKRFHINSDADYDQIVSARATSVEFLLLFEGQTGEVANIRLDPGWVAVAKIETGTLYQHSTTKNPLPPDAGKNVTEPSTIAS